MVVIRLRPKGKKRQKTYRVVVDHKKNSLQGKNIEDLGWLNRHTDEFDINKERAEYWLGNGAQPSDSVYNLFVTAGIIDGKKRAVHSTRKRGKDEEEESSEEKTEETPKESTDEGGDESEGKEDQLEEENKEEESETEKDKDSESDDDNQDDDSEEESKEENEGDDEEDNEDSEEEK